MTDGHGRTPSWSPDQLGSFVDHVRGDRLFALWMLIATTGIRLDTLVDLRRDDVDLQQSRLSPRPAAVERAAFSLGVVRSYALDPDTHESLREHVVAWDKAHEGQRSDRLFVWEDGATIHPKSVEVLFRRHCQQASLPAVPLQAMRQAYVVAALETGIPTTVIGERLGSRVTPTSITRIPHVDPSLRTSDAGGAATSQRDDPNRRQQWHLRSL